MPNKQRRCDIRIVRKCAASTSQKQKVEGSLCLGLASHQMRLHGLFLVATFILLFPFWWIVTSSFKNPIDAAAWPPLYVPFLNFQPTLDTWQGLLSKESMLFRVTMNSLISDFQSRRLHSPAYTVRGPGSKIHHERTNTRCG
jgi:hypothetical protein